MFERNTESVQCISTAYTVVETWKTRNIGAVTDFLGSRNVIYRSILHDYEDIKRTYNFRSYCSKICFFLYSRGTTCMFQIW